MAASANIKQRKYSIQNLYVCLWFTAKQNFVYPHSDQMIMHISEKQAASTFSSAWKAETEILSEMLVTAY